MELNSIDLQIYSIPGLQKQSWGKQIRAETLRQRWHLLAEHGPCTGHFCCSAASSKDWSFRFIHRKCCQGNNQRCGQKFTFESFHQVLFIKWNVGKRWSLTFGKWVQYILVCACNGPLIIHLKLFSNHFNNMSKC